MSALTELTIDRMRRDPIIKSIKIRGLHGYKDVDVSFSGSLKVIIAENGTGKTTILNIANAFLNGRFAKLSQYSFDSIECSFNNGESLSYDRQEIDLFRPMEPITEELAGFANCSPDKIIDLASFYGGRDIDSRFHENALARKIYHNSPFDWDGIHRRLARIYMRWEKILKRSGQQDILGRLNHCLGGAEVVYLPTYRRIELPGKKGDSSGSVSSGLRIRPHRASDTDVDQDMFFGLNDVEDRLKSLAEQVSSLSNIGYRRASAKILDDLLVGNIKKAMLRSTELPGVESLELFFSRISNEEDLARRMQAISSMYSSGKIESDDFFFLKYFLGEIKEVVDSTKQTEKNLQDFVGSVNDFLSISSDEKEFIYDQRTMSVTILDKNSGNSIDFNSLSSGEKQVISLLSKFYLYEGEKIILIDEPELSLSMDWQRLIIPKIFSATSCRQVLAITHSPFIFDNECDPFASPLVVRRRSGV